MEYLHTNILYLGNIPIFIFKKLVMLEYFHKFGKNTNHFKNYIMSAATIMLHQPSPEKVIRHSLNSSYMSTEKLFHQLKAKGYDFIRDQKIGNYTFDFYCPTYKLAIEVDSYAHEYDDVYNKDDFKVLKINSLNITVLRITDYQILIDSDEIFRYLRRYTNSYSATSYLV